MCFPFMTFILDFLALIKYFVVFGIYILKIRTVIKWGKNKQEDNHKTM